MGVRREGETKRSFVPGLEITIKKQIFLERPEVGILIPNNWFDSCIDSFFSAWNSHYTRVRFTVTVSCSDELAVHSCPLHGRPQKFFQGGGKVDILLIFFRSLAMQRKWTYTKEKMFSVTATVAYSVFPVRKLYSKQMFVLASMDFLKLS